MKRRYGFTLIELMVVIFIIGLLATTATMGFASVFSKDNRDIAVEFVSNVKYLFDRANFTSSYIRIEFDFEKNKYTVTASKDRVLLFGKKREVALGQIEISDKEKKRAEMIEEEEKRKEEARSSFEREAEKNDEEDDGVFRYFSEHSMKRYQSARFDKIMVDEDVNFTVDIPENVVIAAVYTEYYTDYVTSGKAEIIIFPNNYIQRSVVVFQNKDSDDFVSVLIEPYSGYSEIRNGYYKLSEEEEEIEEDD